MSSEARQLTVFVEAYAVSDHGDGPVYIILEVTRELAHRLAELRDLCDAHNLSEVRAWGGPKSWGPSGIEEELRLVDDELVVSGGTCRFTAHPKHADYCVESRAIEICDLIRTLDEAEAPRFFGEDPLALQALVAEYAGIDGA